MIRVPAGRLVHSAGLVIVMLSSCHSLGAQAVEGFIGGIGYIATPPDALLGVHVLGIRPSGWGAFADAVTGHRTAARDPDFVSGVGAAEAEKVYGDWRVQRVVHWRAAHAGVVRALTPALAVYGGGAFARHDAFTEFHDQSRERGNDSGYYWARDHEATGTRVSAAAGALFLLTPRVVAHFGGSNGPPGVRAGITYLVGARTPFRPHTNYHTCVERWTESAC